MANAAGEDERGGACEICCEVIESGSGSSATIVCSCGLRVHPSCYGAASGSNFVCAACVYWRQLGFDTNACDLVCALCNRRGGALKSGTEGLWVHVNCVLYSIDGPTFRNPASRTAPINIHKAIAANARNKFKCELCQSHVGFTNKCAFPGCMARLHVTCAFAHNLKPKLKLIAAKIQDNAQPPEFKTVERIIKMVTCDKHSTTNARNAIETYEVTQLQKTDISRLCRPEGPGPGGGPGAAAPVAPALQGMSPPAGAPGAPNVLPYYPQWSYSQYPPFYYGQQPGHPPGMQQMMPTHMMPPQPPYPQAPGYNTWSPHQYGYAQHILQRTSPFPHWGQYGLQASAAAAANRHSTPATNTPAHHARVRTTASTSAGLVPTASLTAGPSGSDKTSPSAAERTKSEPVKKGKGKAKQTKSEHGAKPVQPSVSPQKKRVSVRSGSNAGGRQSSSRKSTSASRASTTSRGKAEEEYIGAPTTARGTKVNWSRLEPFMASLQHQETFSKLNSIFESMETGNRTALYQSVKWRWVDEKPLSIPQLERIWSSQLVAEGIPYSVLISADDGVAGTTHIWSFWKKDVARGEYTVVDFTIVDDHAAELLRARPDVVVSEQDRQARTTRQAPAVGACCQEVIMSSPTLAGLVQMALSGGDGAVHTQTTYSGNPTAGIDVCSWNEIVRLESLFRNHITSTPFFVLLKKVPPELFASVKQTPAATQKYLQEKENAAFVLDPMLLRKTASTTKKVYLHTRFWDLNPPVPLQDSAFCEQLRSLLPPNSYSVNTQTNFLNQPPEAVPISDETTREWLTAAQRVRQLRSQQALGYHSGGLGVSPATASPGLDAPNKMLPDFQKAAKGEDFVRLLSSEQYWRTLLFHDDFVRRQMTCILSVWSKRRAKLVSSMKRIRQFFHQEHEKKPWLVDDQAAIKAVTLASSASNRWSAMRWWFQCGHQDPQQALVDKVKFEHDNRAILVDGIPPPTGDPNAPGAVSTKMYFCMVCFGADTDTLNPLSTCIRCGCLAHNHCYAIGAPGQLELEAHPWVCDRCTSDRADLTSKKNHHMPAPPPAYCAVCLQYGGCLKRLSVGSDAGFIHITCAIWLHPLINCTDWGQLSTFQMTAEVQATIAQRRKEGIEDVCVVCARNKLKAEGIEWDGPADLWEKAKQYFASDAVLETAPLGCRGLTVPCVHDSCNVRFHPMCAWLAGYRVSCEPDFTRSLCEGTFLPALECVGFCNEHSTYESRMPTEEIEAHRRRAYSTKTGRFAGTDDDSTTMLPDLVSSVSDSCMVTESTGAAAAETTGFTRKAADRAKTRRPSLVDDAAAPGQWDTLCDERLNTPDDYLLEICQSCLQNENSRPLVCCDGCERVRVHAGGSCEEGVLDDKSLCAGCRDSQEIITCALCPRLGGAYVSLGEGSYAHKYCLTSAVGTQDANGTWSALQALSSTKGAECTYCKSGSGYLVKCAESACEGSMHPLCAALCSGSKSEAGEEKLLCHVHHSQTAPCIRNAAEQPLLKIDSWLQQDATPPERKRAKRKRLMLGSSDEEHF